jgi:hypothetical protein
VFDVSEMMPGEQAQFFTDFVNTFRAKNRGSVNFIIEESHIFMPQAGEKGGWTPKMLHAGNNLVALGRSRGFRIALLSQRPAKLHKDSLTQVQTLVAMCVIAPQDRDAIHNWIKGQGSPEKEKEIMASLASLRPGQGWVWSPRAGVLECSQFPMPKTFDSSKAPDFEEKEGSAPVLVPVKMDEIKSRLGKVETERKANDPKELKAEIRRLTAELAAKPAAGKVDEKWLAGILKEHGEDSFAHGAIEGFSVGVRACYDHNKQAIEQAFQLPCPYRIPKRRGEGSTIAFHVPTSTSLPKTLPPGRLSAGHDQNAPTTSKMLPSTKQNAPLGGGMKRILVALAQVYPKSLSKRQLGLRAVMSSTSGSFNTYLASLRTQGLIDGTGEAICITAVGIDQVGSFPSLPTGEELLRFWMDFVGSGSGAARILRFLYDYHSHEMSREDLGTAVEMSPTSGSFNTYLSKLTTLQLVTRNNGRVALSEELI